VGQDRVRLGREEVLGPSDRKGVGIGEDDILFGPTKGKHCIYLVDALLVIPIWCEIKSI
jgi:hypothetical protein